MEKDKNNAACFDKIEVEAHNRTKCMRKKCEEEVRIVGKEADREVSKIEIEKGDVHIPIKDLLHNELANRNVHKRKIAQVMHLYFFVRKK